MNAAFKYNVFLTATSVCYWLLNLAIADVVNDGRKTRSQRQMILCALATSPTVCCRIICIGLSKGVLMTRPLTDAVSMMIETASEARDFRIWPADSRMSAIQD